MLDYFEKQMQVLDTQHELFFLRSKFIEERNYLHGIDPQTLSESERIILNARILRNRLALREIVVLNNKLMRHLLH